MAEPEEMSAASPSTENDQAPLEPSADETPIASDAAIVGDVAPEPKRTRRFPWRWLAVAAVVAALVALALPVFSTLQPSYYRRYPSLQSRMQNWSESTHARVPCSGCHVDPGVSGLARFAVRAVPAFYSQLVYGPKPTNLLQVPDTQACQKCHTTYRQVSANGDLLIPHRAHVVVLKIKCATCHKNLVHSKNTQGFNNPEMSMCLGTCHDGKQATNRCSKCHTRKEVPASHKQKDWLQVHPTLTKTIDCGSCHAWAPDYCRQCHLKKPASHTGNWKTLHAAAAKERGSKGCVFCHGEKFCKDCH